MVLLKLGAVGLVGAVAAFFVLRGVDIRATIDEGLSLIRQAGPGVFFLAMSLLPAAGVPMLAFTLSVGPVFGPAMGIGWVIVLSLFAVGVNAAITYWLAAYALRPLLTRLFTRLGYALPEAGADTALDLCILLRVTPGVPFFAQGYLLGLARVPFSVYMLTSCTISWLYSAAFIVFGDALLHGKGRGVLIGVSALAALSVGTHLLRKRFQKAKVKAAA